MTSVRPLDDIGWPLGTPGTRSRQPRPFLPGSFSSMVGGVQPSRAAEIMLRKKPPGSGQCPLRC